MQLKPMFGCAPAFHEFDALTQWVGEHEEDHRCAYQAHVVTKIVACSIVFALFY